MTTFIHYRLAKAENQRENDGELNLSRWEFLTNLETHSNLELSSSLKTSN